MNNTETIFALSSGRLPSGIAVFRLSGSRCRFVLETICGLMPEPRVMRKVAFKDLDGVVVDHGLCVYFPAPKSFTGEDSVELHVHGSIAVAKKLADVLSGLDGVRAAEAGEFTKRSFMNGKLDLAEVEGLSDLIAAESDAQRRLALAQSDGRLSAVYTGWRDRLVQCRAMVEAAIDFSEEDDVQTRVLETILTDIEVLNAEIKAWVKRSADSEMVRDGFNVVIVGAPNAGKSSLLNALAGRDVAIISDEPGTTRDLIDVRLELGGCLVVVTDTAGIRPGAGKVEAIGIDRAIERAIRADLVVLLEDVSSPVELAVGLGTTRILRVGNKVDLGVQNPGGYDVLISVKTGAGIETLIGTIDDLAREAVGDFDIVTVQTRQKGLLVECGQALEICLGLSDDTELIAENLRVATDCIGRLTGAVDVEELLGVIFSRFCIGK
jgi:tRNA modification GTPase